MSGHSPEGPQAQQGPAEADRLDRDFAEAAIRRGFVTMAQVEEAMTAKRTIIGLGMMRGLSEIMVEKGLLTEVQAEAVRRTVETGGEAKIVGGFELLEKLGEGGMGVVYKARQMSLDRTVALKILPERLARDRDFVARFQREARVAAMLDHVNVVRALDFGEAGGVRYFAMEFVEGRDVGSILDEKGKMSEPEALHVVVQVARALEHACSHSLIHRDVKPDNILVTEAGIAKLADLGLARSTAEDGTRITLTGTALGTPHYISPEQARGETDVDIRTDIYSLGVTLYHMLAGKPPFTGSNAAVVITRRLTEDPPWIRNDVPEVFEGTAYVVLKMMAREREGRYANPTELMGDLELVADGKMPALAAPDGAASSGQRRGPDQAAKLRKKDATGRRPGPRRPDNVVVPTGPRRPVARDVRTGGRSAAVIAGLLFGVLAVAAVAGVAVLYPGEFPLLEKLGLDRLLGIVSPKLEAEAARSMTEIDRLAEGGDFGAAVARAESAAATFRETLLAARFVDRKRELDAMRSRAEHEAAAKEALADVIVLREGGRLKEAQDRAAQAREEYADTSLVEEFKSLRNELAAASLAKERLAAKLETIGELEKAGAVDRALAKAREAQRDFQDLKDTRLTRPLDEAIKRLEARKRERERLVRGAKAELAALKGLLARKEYAAAVARAERAMKKYRRTEHVDRFKRIVAEANKVLGRTRALSARIKVFLDSAEEARRAKRYADAVTAYEKALQLRESDQLRRHLKGAKHLMHLGLSRRAEEAGDLGRAIEEVKTAISITPTRAAASWLEELERRSRLRQILVLAREMESSGKPERARKVYRRALAYARPAERAEVKEALDRTERKIAYVAALKEARTHVAAERWADAARAVKRALKARPDDPAAVALLASVRRTLEESRRRLAAEARPEPRREPAFEPVRTTNGIGMAFVLVLPGEYTVGNSLGQPDEQPVHWVRLRPFFIGTHEVTNGQYERYDRRHRKRRSQFSPGDDHPVVNVSWTNAGRFCEWLTRREGTIHRLPTEAEWEAAARGEDARRFPWGDGLAEEGGVFRANWGRGESRNVWARDGFVFASPVGSFPAGVSPFGCLDMAGNVWEWCFDWYDPAAYSKLPANNPVGPRKGREKVIRGGSFSDGIELARSSNRDKRRPNAAEGDVGFRVVRELDPKADKALLDGLEG